MYCNIIYFFLYNSNFINNNKVLILEFILILILINYNNFILLDILSNYFIFIFLILKNNILKIRIIYHNKNE